MDGGRVPKPAVTIWSVDGPVEVVKVLAQALDCDRGLLGFHLAPVLQSYLGKCFKQAVHLFPHPCSFCFSLAGNPIPPFVVKSDRSKSGENIGKKSGDYGWGIDGRVCDR